MVVMPDFYLSENYSDFNFITLFILIFSQIALVEELENCPGFTKKYDGLKEDEVFFPGCGDSGMPGFETEIIKYEKNSSNNELYIYEVAGFFGYLGDLFNLYKDYSKTELVVENVSDDKLNLLTYKDKLNTYKYTFKYKDNGDSETNWRDYCFYSVERVK